MLTTDPTESTDGAEPIVRSEEWIEAFESQATHALIGQARRYAAKHARLIARAGGRVEAMDLVQSVLDDTLAGVLGWEPSRASLYAHVMISIRGRARHLRERAKKYEHRPIHNDKVARELDQHAIHEVTEAESAESARAFAEAAVEELRVLAGTDADVLAVLDAYAHDAFTPKEVMAYTNLSKKRFRNARLRLDRLVDRQCQDTTRVRA
jgi:hypothetical protein